MGWRVGRGHRESWQWEVEAGAGWGSLSMGSCTLLFLKMGSVLCMQGLVCRVLHSKDTKNVRSGALVCNPVRDAQFRIWNVRLSFESYSKVAGFFRFSCNKLQCIKEKKKQNNLSNFKLFLLPMSLRGDLDAHLTVPGSSTESFPLTFPDLLPSDGT